MSEGPDQPVLVTGASGYVGGRLVPYLLEAGLRVRCLARSPRKLQARPWADHPRVEIVGGDLDDPSSVERALTGCWAAFYLVHSMMSASQAYRERDRAMATDFAQAAGTAGVARIIYLGGLGETGAGLSEHLTSRREVETALAAGPVPVTVFRAAIIIGSGSASFEILRYLVERLPVMITPRWVHTECQPIAIRNVLHYLAACLHTPETVGETFDIGGPEVVTYRRLMETTAARLGLRRRLIVPVPVLTPRLSALWIHLVTPVSHRIARPLAEGLRNRVVCRDDRITRLIPQQLLSVDAAIELSLGNVRRGTVPTAWSDAGPMPGDPDWAGGKVFEDRRETLVAASPEALFRTLCRIGGANGYFGTRWLWRLRGLLDQLVGGPGLRRGRRDPEQVYYGDALDFWRVTAIEAPRRLELRAEMKLPGIALLRFELTPEAAGCRLAQVALFKPRGLLGLAYWYAVMPLHGIVFNTMLGGIKQRAEALAA